MTPEQTSIFLDLADRAAHDFLGKYDPRIRAIHVDFEAEHDEENVTVFHQAETVTIAALMKCGVEARLAAALVGSDIIPLAQPVPSDGDFETADGAHWRLAISLPWCIDLDLDSIIVWALDESGTPHRLENLDPTDETIAANRLPTDLPARIEAACSNAMNWSDIASLPRGKRAQALRNYLSRSVAHHYEGKSDAGIRVACLSEDGPVSVFNYETSLCVAALIRIGVPPSLAAAFVHQAYAVAAPVGGGDVYFPAARPYGADGANWAVVDFIKLKDGTQWAIFMADLGQVFDPDRYDVWSIRGKKSVIGDVTLPNGKPLHDPTRKTIRGEAKYRAFANRFSENEM